ncbi:hypothetical protein WD019_02430 [Fictibacillus sp. Mic-4]|uniref:hypothetical protein n=1 Tax=Fictibacillus sp. Mic-4 TaxID=3132826 RepID=UPI003CFB08E1
MNQTQFETEANEIITAVRRGNAWNGLDVSDRQTRIEIMNDLFKEYPGPYDKELIEKMTDAVLHEELTDTDQWKVKHNEYPFLSETQLARRKDGIHQRKNEGGSGEVSLNKAWAIDVTRKDYSLPKRKDRTNNDQIAIENATKSRNKEIHRKYREFTKEQPVTTYTLSQEELEARGWR